MTPTTTVKTSMSQLAGCALLACAMAVAMGGAHPVVAKSGLCVSSWVARVDGPVLPDAATPALLKFEALEESLVCDNYKLGQDNATITNKEHSESEVRASLQIMNIGLTPGAITFTPVFSQARTPKVGVSKTVPSTGVPGVPYLDVFAAFVDLELEKRETVQIEVTATGSSFLVLGANTFAISRFDH